MLRKSAVILIAIASAAAAYGNMQALQIAPTCEVRADVDSSDVSNPGFEGNEEGDFSDHILSVTPCRRTLSRDSVQAYTLDGHQRQLKVSHHTLYVYKGRKILKR